MTAGTHRRREDPETGVTHGGKPERDAAGRGDITTAGQPLSRWLGQSRQRGKVNEIGDGPVSRRLRCPLPQKAGSGNARLAEKLAGAKMALIPVL